MDLKSDINNKHVMKNIENMLENFGECEKKFKNKVLDLFKYNLFILFFLGNKK